MAKVLSPGRNYPALIAGAPYGGKKNRGSASMQKNWQNRDLWLRPLLGTLWGTENPAIFPENFSVAVDYLGIGKSLTEREKNGVIENCGSGGLALSAAPMRYSYQGGCHGFHR